MLSVRDMEPQCSLEVHSNYYVSGPGDHSDEGRKRASIEHEAPGVACVTRRKSYTERDTHKRRFSRNTSLVSDTPTSPSDLLSLSVGLSGRVSLTDLLVCS